MTLTMTRNVKDNKGTASVIGGAIAGLVLSIVLAITFVETLEIAVCFVRVWKRD